MNTENESVDESPESKGDVDNPAATQTEMKKMNRPDLSMHAKVKRASPHAPGAGETNASELIDDDSPNQIRIRTTADERALCDALAAMSFDEFVAFVGKFRPDIAHMNPLLQRLIHLMMNLPTTPPSATPFGATEKEEMMRAIRAARQ